MTRSLTLAASTWTALALAVSAAAQDAPRRADLDLSTSAGAQVLARRTRATIARMCGAGGRNQAAAASVKCRMNAWASVQPRAKPSPGRTTPARGLGDAVR